MRISTLAIAAGLFIALPVLADDLSWDDDNDHRRPAGMTGERRGEMGRRSDAQGRFGMFGGRFDSSQQRRAGNMDRGGERGGASRHRLDMVLSQIEAENPKQAEELRKLQKENPQEFQQRLQKILQERREQRRECQEKLQNLVEEYHKNPDEGVKNQIKAELSKQFDMRLKMEQRKFEEFKKRYDEMRKRYETRVENKDKIVELKMDELLREPELRW